MNKKELIVRTSEILRNNNIRKPVSMPRQVFHISDDEGNKRDFVVRKTEKTVGYNTNDITAIFDVLISEIEEAIKRGETVHIHGFGDFMVHKRAARRTIHPDTKEVVEVKERYVPKFSYGKDMRRAAKLYELSLEDEEMKENGFFPPEEEDDE